MKTKITPHAYRHAKDRMQWTTDETNEHAENAYKCANGREEHVNFIGRLMRVHKRANHWGESGGAVFLFSGRIVVAVYRAEWVEK